MPDVSITRTSNRTTGHDDGQRHLPESAYLPPALESYNIHEPEWTRFRPRQLGQRLQSSNVSFSPCEVRMSFWSTNTFSVARVSIITIYTPWYSYLLAAIQQVGTLDTLWKNLSQIFNFFTDEFISPLNLISYTDILWPTLQFLQWVTQLVFNNCSTSHHSIIFLTCGYYYQPVLGGRVFLVN